MTSLCGDYQTAERMALKERAVPLPDLDGKAVLDVGCDHGHWCWLAAERGAGHVLGLDRNRHVRGEGLVDLIARNAQEAKRRGLEACRFRHMELGRQWHDLGRFDVVLCLSMYHHVFNLCGDHRAIWFWLWRQLRHGGLLLWENPTDDRDSVVQRNVRDELRGAYTREAILAAAEDYFEVAYYGPALHEETREVWRCTPRAGERNPYGGWAQPGAGGASKAFVHAEGRRIRELREILDVEPIPGSLNVKLTEPFDWERDYYRARLLDVVDRREGLGGRWAERWVRLYPLTLRGAPCWALRFEGESYGEDFVELISPFRLRDSLGDDLEVTLCRGP